ncbi:MAG: hypothetical protein PHQ72_01615 [Hespellia sp.]|nr:hypothetical protein [Hespellia sp.]
MKNITELTCIVKSFFHKEWTTSEKVLLVIDCILFGVLLGALWSPKREKSTVMGSYNSGNGCGNVPPEASEED